jgi:hypothetical protein
MALPAELLQMTDEELKDYIPKTSLSTGVGSTRKSYDNTQSPEEFRAGLQYQMNLKPGEKGYGMPLTNYVTNAEQQQQAYASGGGGGLGGWANTCWRWF